MDQQLAVNQDLLLQQAQQFSDLTLRRAAHEARVTDIATELAKAWKGEAGSALQFALNVYRAEAEDVRLEEIEIGQAIAEAAQSYGRIDGVAADGLHNAMNI